MSQFPSFGKPFYDGLVVLTCAGSVGSQLYLEHVESTAEATPSPRSPRPAPAATEKEAPAPPVTPTVVVRDITDEVETIEETLQVDHAVRGV